MLTTYGAFWAALAVVVLW